MIMPTSTDQVNRGFRKSLRSTSGDRTRSSHKMKQTSRIPPLTRLASTAALVQPRAGCSMIP